MIYECIGAYAKNPYYIDAICMNLFSLEELCYYLHENAFLLDDSVMKPELCDFIEKELLLPELAGRLSGLIRAKGSLSAFVSMILEEAHFCSREELKRIEGALRDNAAMGPLARRKIRGDYLLANGKYTLAAGEYSQALTDTRLEEPETRAALYHNLGVAYARMFLFEMAEEAFLKAYEIVPDEASYEQYLAALRLGNSKSGYLDLVVKNKLDQSRVAALEEKIRTLVEQSRGSKDNLLYKKALERKEAGEVAEYYRSLDEILSGWKREYRQNNL